MNITKLTLAELLQELQWWIIIPETTIEDAKKTGICYNNNERFMELALAWTTGIYDKDLDSLYRALVHLIPFDDGN